VIEVDPTMLPDGAPAAPVVTAGEPPPVAPVEAAPRPASPVAAPAVAAVAPAAVAPEVLVRERTVDGRGRIVARVVDGRGRVLKEQVVGAVTDLPLLATRRAEDGTVIEIVQDVWGALEVRRDPAGRFLSARPVDGAEPAAPGPALLARERTLDAEGRLLERTVDATGRVVSATVVGTIADLELVTEGRARDGRIVQLLRDGARRVEVTRDPIGRFLSARVVE
jgi:hypothetical protein